jgi:hypothetical protein
LPLDLYSINNIYSIILGQTEYTINIYTMF